MTQLRLVYIVGPPGAGKSTLMAELTSGLLRVPRTDGKLPRDELYHRERLVGVELGRRRGAFSGTDALAMNIHPVACAWVRVSSIPVVYAEGQRLSTMTFLSVANLAGRAVDLIHLDPGPERCAFRRAERGSAQSDSWVKGATTRAARLAREADRRPWVTVTRVSDSDPDTADELRAELGLTLEVTA